MILTAKSRHLASILTVMCLCPAIIAESAEPAPVASPDPGTADFFETRIRPVLEQRCYQCHSQKSDELEGGLLLDHATGLLRGGDTGPAVVLGSPSQSLLIEALRYDGFEMPPDGQLPAQTIEDFERWIRAGALDTRSSLPAAVQSGDRKKHWSTTSVVQPDVPRSTGRWETNPIDSFVWQRLSANGLSPSPEADRLTLIRRVTLGLLGLPPSPNEVAEFLRDPTDLSADYARLVDRLLGSPRFGERWAQHWLDVIRWAETVGFETNLPRPNAWPYRDWVITAMNEDLTYDRFILAQIAGDTIGADAALGFLVAGPANLPGQIGRDEEAMRQARQDELDEVIRTVSQGLFGLTIGCARCHNHKFDPILQSDYYSMQAVFAGLTYGDRRLRGPQNTNWTRQLPALRQRVAGLRSELEEWRSVLKLRPSVESVHTERFEAVQASSIRMTINATGSGGPASLYEFEVWTASSGSAPPRNVALASEGAVPFASSFALENQTRHFDNLVDGSVDQRQAFPWIAAAAGRSWLKIDLSQPATIDRIVWHRGRTVPADYEIEVLVDGESPSWTKVADTGDRMPRLDDLRGADQVRLTGVSAARSSALLDKMKALRDAEAELARLSAGPQVYAARFSAAPPATWLLVRGDPMRRGRIVQPNAPACLQDRPFAAGQETARRLSLVKHLTRPDHPLTARVIVNRIWQHHFGTGLVETPSDFGRMGGTASHRDLLDWLAAEFVAQGWSMKWLHRLIVSSQTYRQSSRPHSQALSIDGESRLLWRFPPRRLSAEAIRDSILCVSGQLNLEMGGPGFDFFDQRGGLSDYTAKETFAESGWKRMIYSHKIRMQAVDIFGAFDCPDAGQMQPQRTRSVTPIQALSLLNSPFTNRQAQFFANRVASESAATLKAQLTRAFRIAICREPTPREMQHLVPLAQQHGLVQVCRVLLNTSEFVYLN